MSDLIERPTCGHCGLPYDPSSGNLRHFGWFTAHPEAECLRLLKSALASEQEARLRAEQELAGAYHLLSQSDVVLICQFRDGRCPHPKQCWGKPGNCDSALRKDGHD